ncbi:hypothetical protein [Streptomyces sp. NPDC023588]|uniref:hypothetical protein n=1 Tax=Streptomyces sp. NPDC023588 TaxID=3154907 RepID=UPI0033C4B01F
MSRKFFISGVMLLSAAVLLGVLTQYVDMHVQEAAARADRHLYLADRYVREANEAVDPHRHHLLEEARLLTGWSEYELAVSDDQKQSRLWFGAIAASALIAGAVILMLGRRRPVVPSKNSAILIGAALLVVGGLVGALAMQVHTRVNETEKYRNINRALADRRLREADQAANVQRQWELRDEAWIAESWVRNESVVLEVQRQTRLWLGLASASALTAGAVVLFIGRRRPAVPGETSPG